MDREIYEFGPVFMRNPKPKTRNRLAPEVLDCREFLRGFEGNFYEEPKPCPFCGSEERVKNGQKDRLLCKLIADDGEFEDVWVKVQMFICKECGEVSRGEEKGKSRLNQVSARTKR